MSQPKVIGVHHKRLIIFLAFHVIFLMMNLFKSCLFLLLACATSCTGLRNNLLFRTNNSINPESFALSAEQANKGYTIMPQDRIAISVFTNDGERLIDPNQEFETGNATPPISLGLNQNQNMMQNDNTNGFMLLPLTSNNAAPSSYLVDGNGKVVLPQVGEVTLAGLNLEEAGRLLEKSFAAFYEKPFVKVQYLNKRIVLMGALGDKIIPLRNENMTLIEVLAIAGNFQEKSKPSNIRVIRGDLKEPSVQIVDLSTIEGLQKANLLVLPNDIVYVEPRRRLDRDSIIDFNTIFSPLASLATLALTFTLLLSQ